MQVFFALTRCTSLRENKIELQIQCIIDCLLPSNLSHTTFLFRYSSLKALNTDTNQRTQARTHTYFFLRLIFFINIMNDILFMINVRMDFKLYKFRY